MECGVFTGILSLAICHYLQFQNYNKSFYLFDTWSRIPLDLVKDDEKDLVNSYNDTLYSKHDVYETTKQAFSCFPNCILVKGLLPDTLTVIPDRIAFLSIDLNNARSEADCIERLWPRLTSGAIVVIDDYGWVVHESQRCMWNEFAKDKGHAIASLPTGQGLIIKS